MFTSSVLGVATAERVFNLCGSNAAAAAAAEVLFARAMNSTLAVVCAQDLSQGSQISSKKH